MAFPDLARAGLAPHAVRRLYLFWPNEPTAWVDVGATLERKLAALRCHESQLGNPDEVLERVRGWAVEEGGTTGAPAAEAFRLIVIDDEPDEGPHEPRSDATTGRATGEVGPGGEQATERRPHDS
jgi:hypothetical protein